VYPLKSTLLIVAFNRPELLAKLFESFEKSENSQSQFVVIVHQEGNIRVKNQISLFQSRHKLVHVVQTEGVKGTTEANIAFNRFKGYDYCFNVLQSDYVIALEDDVIISSDVFKFTEFIMSEYWAEKHFRGINFGSYVKFTDATSRQYSKVRYGIHGPASAIHKKTWRQFNNSSVRIRAEDTHWDGAIEYFLKTGFMICPVNSRYLDFGYGGSHTLSSNDAYFVNLNESYIKNYVNDDFKYSLVKITIPWFVDMHLYRPNENWKYCLLYFVNLRNDKYFFFKLERLLYKVLILKRIDLNKRI
jgi:hypothetical protein